MKLDWIKNSTKVKFALLLAVTVFVYGFLCFIIFGFHGGSSFWISFAFAVISIMLAFYIAYCGVRTAKRLTDWLFNLPILRWCVIYVVAEIVMATCFMIISTRWKIVLVPQFLLPFLFLVLVIPSFAQKSYVAEVKQETVDKVSYIRQINAKLIALIPRANATDAPLLKQELEKAVDMLRHSDPMSASTLEEVEEKIEVCVNQADELIRDEKYEEATPVIRELCYLIEERNQLVIASKLIQY